MLTGLKNHGFHKAERQIKGLLLAFKKGKEFSDGEKISVCRGKKLKKSVICEGDR